MLLYFLLPLFYGIANIFIIIKNLFHKVAYIDPSFTPTFWKKQRKPNIWSAWNNYSNRFERFWVIIETD